MSTAPDPTPSRPVRVGLLQCGHVRADVATDHGDYPELFGALFAGTPVDLVTYVADQGRLPADPGECDAWVVSGSAASVYEPFEWIDRTSRFLTRVVDADVPLVAVCFGHQLLAQALGGRVERSDRGWGVGIHRYDVVAPVPRWPGPDAPTDLTLLASHQDQVTRLPDGATVLASSAHCPVAAYALGPRVVAVQAHPEFTPPLSRDLIVARRDAIGADRADAALAALDDPDAVARLDHRAVAGWFAHVLTSAPS
jgi:GMP synthase (glutamine-hydrolysing)